MHLTHYQNLINEDGSVVCEVDDSGASGISTTFVTQSGIVPPNKYLGVSAYCPPGYSISGGGFYKFSGMDIRSNRPQYIYRSGYSWTVVAFNNAAYEQNIYCYAQCIKLSLPPACKKSPLCGIEEEKREAKWVTQFDSMI